MNGLLIDALSCQLHEASKRYKLQVEFREELLLSLTSQETRGHTDSFWNRMRLNDDLISLWRYHDVPRRSKHTSKAQEVFHTR